MTSFEKLKQIVKNLQPSTDPSHDFLHILRVLRRCEVWGRRLSARMEILVPAALLHDIVHIPKNHPDRERAAELAAREAEKILLSLGVAEADSEVILSVIREHSYSAGKKPSSLESAILQDADRLDAIGAIGIARVFACGALMGSRFYSEVEPFAATRALDDKSFALDHFYQKLLRLPELLNTAPAREEAQSRIALMHSFLEQFKREMLPESTESLD